MIELTKINGELIIVNSRLIEYVVTIPETKIVMMNGKYHIVKEPAGDIIRKVVDFEQKAAGNQKNPGGVLTGVSQIPSFDRQSTYAEEDN